MHKYIYNSLLIWAATSSPWLFAVYGGWKSYPLTLNQSGFPGIVSSSLRPNRRQNPRVQDTGQTTRKLLELIDSSLTLHFKKRSKIDNPTTRKIYSPSNQLSNLPIQQLCSHLTNHLFGTTNTQHGDHRARGEDPHLCDPRLHPVVHPSFATLPRSPGASWVGLIGRVFFFAWLPRWLL